MSKIRVTGTQYDFLVGDPDGNANKIISAIDEALKVDSDVLVTPELALTGYPPEDLLLNGALIEATEKALVRIAEASNGKDLVVLVGYAQKLEEASQGAFLDAKSRKLANAVAVIYDGKIVSTVHKTLLPTYGVFDEGRYFASSRQNPQVFKVGDFTFGIPICEDLWKPGVADMLVEAGADLLIVPNASPYHRQKSLKREKIASETVERTRTAMFYLANVGGQDELVFDGGSVAFDENGTLIARAEAFKEELLTVDFEMPSVKKPSRKEGVVVKAAVKAPKVEIFHQKSPRLEGNEEIYSALVQGLKAYINKNNFRSVLLGLSGGIDSALVAVLAADAIGGEKVWGVGMPGPYSSGGSVKDAQELAERIGCRFDVLSIKELYEKELQILKGTVENPGPFAGTTFDSSEENLQARLRMTLLMSISNKHGNLLLTTGNKSETSVGYCTLYGDTAGGYAPIKDVYKTLVFDLCAWRNTLTQDQLMKNGFLGSINPIPEETLTKPPSAELAPDQRDDQSLPPYPVLDGILERYIEKVLSPDEIIEHGFEPETVKRICRLVDINEYKRRQAAPGVKITKLSFGRDRRLPITNGWRPVITRQRIDSTFPTRAEIEAKLSTHMNALEISSWWEHKDSEGLSAADKFLKNPQDALHYAQETVNNIKKV